MTFLKIFLYLRYYSINCLVCFYQGWGRKLIKFSYLNYPTICDVMSGQKWLRSSVLRKTKINFIGVCVSLNAEKRCGGILTWRYQQVAETFSRHTELRFREKKNVKHQLGDKKRGRGVISWRIFSTLKTCGVTSFGCSIS